ncbi:MAG: hypothetical protein KDB07_03420 [Planctomycetes bacterium]|nr:hypothetical protein [Planctomycetota bacterium]
MILALVSRTRRDESANRDAKIDAKRALAEAEAASGRIPKAVIQRLRDSRRRLSNERLLRVAKKAGFLKLMDFLSLKTLRFVWREVALILFLLVAITITLTYYYSNALG